jgi:hypothetical protein
VPFAGAIGHTDNSPLKRVKGVIDRAGGHSGSSSMRFTRDGDQLPTMFTSFIEHPRTFCTLLGKIL